MKTFICTLLLMLCSMGLMAQDSGLYYNVERDGEGMDLNRHNDVIQFFVYTYDGYDGCFVYIPEGGLLNEENCHENRWFLSGGDRIVDESDVEGWLYMPFGLNYPTCLPDANDPFQRKCGEAHIVGRYILSRYEDGWRMIVIPFGDILDEDDPLYDQVWEFTEVLFKSKD